VSEPNVSLPVGRFFPIGVRVSQLERLWTTGSMYLPTQRPVDDSVIRAELQGVINDLTTLLHEFDVLKAQESWLD